MTFGATLQMFWYLSLGHLICDFALQSEWMAKNKNKDTNDGHVPWQDVMFAHCAVHAAAVAIITGMAWLSVLEFFCHLVVDDLKCEGKIGFHTDQLVHIFYKAIWAIMAIHVLKTGFWF